MPINSTEVSYGLGQMGSIFTDNTSDAISAPSGKAFVAIQFLQDTKFDTSGGLVAIQDADNALEYITTTGGLANNDPAHDTSGPKGNLGIGGKIVDVNNVFPRGLTIYGRWSVIGLAQGSIIAYIGD
jgi:hypothetical protein